MNEFPGIITDRLILRNFYMSDVNSVYDIFSKDAVTEFYDLDTFTQQDQAEDFIKSRICLNEEENKRAFRWAICMASAPDTVIGSCGFHSINKSFSSMEIGFELSPIHWGRNIAYEAVRAMLDYCFANNFPFPINRVSATTNLENTKSMHLLAKLGFAEEGILRQYGFWKNAFHDVRLFSVLKSEWPTKSNA
ncbi:MAG: N-acetyltransferase [Moraxellaceae bacterium]|nr:MAG: N-acetyltransferase [Moraxellaceae bacterium]